jgi:hypothetical protein
VLQRETEFTLLRRFVPSRFQCSTQYTPAGSYVPACLSGWQQRTASPQGGERGKKRA